MVLLEREHELAALRNALSHATEGTGSGVAVTGDSGTGKSALLEAAVAASPEIRLLRGACDPLRTPRPLGPFRDIARAAGLGSLLRGEDVLLSDVYEELYDAFRNQVSVVVVEDLHWVDAASVDVLRFLVRRLDVMPLALLVSYREFEIGARHPARPLLGDFARLENLTTLHLEPLSLHGVSDLLAGTTLEPQRVHALTGGNPFFATEVAKDPDRPLPTSVRDAVLARTVDVAVEDYEVLQLVATAPDRLDDRVLPALGVDLPTLRRLDSTGLLTRTRGGLAFRHELARQAVEATIPPGGGPRLHARLLEALERIEPQEPAVLTHHAVAARDSVRTAHYAKAAAREAIRAGSHSEAVAFFETALNHLDGEAPVERANLLQQLGYEQYMTSRLGDAISNVSATFPLWKGAGDAAGLSAAHEACAIFQYYSARREKAEAHVDLATDIAQEAGCDMAYASARATRGYLAYMRSDLDVALGCFDEASATALQHADDKVALRTDMMRSVAGLMSGDIEARTSLVDHIEAARSHTYDELASTGYSHLVYLDVEQRRFLAAEHALDESIPFAVERDIPICHQWQTAVRSRLHFARGHWGAALEDAAFVLGEVGMPIATLWPSVVTALIPLRQEGRIPAADSLESAWHLAEQLDEPLRRLAVLAAFAERMWMTDEADPRVTGLAPRELVEVDGTSGSEWVVGELAVWLHRLGLLAKQPTTVAEPYRAAFEGRHDAAASWWHRVGEPFNEAMAWGDSPDPVDRARGIELLDQLGAVATADRQRVALRRDGVTQVPVRPRVSTRANPAGLTNRQLDVAKLVARGFTNAEIAARLYISPKTADHHVSAVLAKLGLPNRRAVAVRADEFALG